MKKFKVGDLVAYTDYFQQWSRNIYGDRQVGLVIGYRFGADGVERPLVQWSELVVQPVHPTNIKRVVE